jgi:hypothetical protein
LHLKILDEGFVYKDIGPSNMTLIFDWLKGYSDEEKTISYRYINVPEEKRDPIITGYFENYKNYFGVESLEQLG